MWSLRQSWTDPDRRIHVWANQTRKSASSTILDSRLFGATTIRARLSVRHIRSSDSAFSLCGGFPWPGGCADSGNLAHGSASSCPPLQAIPARLNFVHWQATSRASQQTHPHRTSGYICCWPPTHATSLAAPRQSTRGDTGGTRSGAAASRRRVLAAICERRQGKRGSAAWVGDTFRAT